MSVRFITEDKGSSINVLQTSFEDEESVSPHKEGWEKGLDELAKYLAGENT